MIGTRKRTQTYNHVSTGLTNATIMLGGEEYLAQLAIRPSTPTIVSKATTDALWTLVVSGLTDTIEWRLSELNGNDFDYAFEAIPGDNFSVGFGWVSQQTNPSTIYVKRKGSTNITVKLERWSV